MGILQKIREAQQNIIIYGAGYCGLMLSELLLHEGIKPKCFFDKSETKNGKKFKEINICKPILLDKNDSIIVAILDKSIYLHIYDFLKELGYKNIYSIYDLKTEETLFRNQKLIFYVPRQWRKKNQTKINEVYQVLGDKLSKDTYQAIIDSITNKTEIEITHFGFEEQYFAYDVYKRQEKEVFLDCGAFRGDILRFFLKNVQKQFERYIAIEPDPDNCIRIEQLMEAKDKRVEIVKYALSNKREQLRIQNYMNENSVIGDSGVLIEADTLDNICMQKGIRPTFIKIDVEGYEVKLLDGAELVIKQCQPTIAIAIYHKPNDLWEIPLRLKRMLPNHRLFLRSYMNVNETILYAVPEERWVL